MNHKTSNAIINVLVEKEMNHNAFLTASKSIKELIIHSSINMPKDECERFLLLEDIKEAHKISRLFEQLTVVMHDDEEFNPQIKEGHGR